MSAPKRKVTLKIIVLGDASVGKTSIIRQYVNQKFSDKYKATIGADFFTDDLVIDGTQVSLQIWDTAGQERFQSLGAAFYRGADACILTFDITNAKTFKNLSKWQDEFLKITTAEVEEWSKSSRVTTMPFFETSAKENINIESAFKVVVADALKLKQEEVFVPEVVNVNLNNATSEHKKDCQC
ncbi:hypothetical protein WA158_000521 [Blastocystis sp. Blastoise]